MNRRSKASLIREVLEERGIDTPASEIKAHLAYDSRIVTDQDVQQQKKLLKGTINESQHLKMSESTVEDVSEQKKKPQSGKISIELLKQVKALRDQVGSNYQFRILLEGIKEIGSLERIEKTLDVLEELM